MVKSMEDPWEDPWEDPIVNGGFNGTRYLNGIFMG
jgi:hypothetical protein